MLSSQIKPGIVMIKGYIFPITGNMTPSAILSELTSMRIVFRMAGKTIRRCAAILAVSMTGLASNRRMLTHKGEASL